jgi:hypothetical protein
MIDEFLNDLRFGMRTLLKNRGFALLAILTLGLGIGANTAIFSVIYGVLLKPLPYTDSDRLVLIRQSAPLIGRADAGVSIKEYFTYRDQASEFEALVEFHQMNFDLLKRGEPDRVNTGVVSTNFFSVLGIQPILGRSFVPDDDKPVRRRCSSSATRTGSGKFGGDRNISRTGVRDERPAAHRRRRAARTCRTTRRRTTSTCRPRRARFARRPNADRSERRVFSILNVFGKLKPGVSASGRRPTSMSSAGVSRRTTRPAYRPGSGFTATTAACARR